MPRSSQTNWRTVVLCTCLFRIAGAIFCLVGSAFTFVEAYNLKYAKPIKPDDGGYAWGYLGWVLFELGSYFIVFDSVVSLIYSAMDEVLFSPIWPFYPNANHPLRNRIRDVALSIGFFFIGMGAGNTAHGYPSEMKMQMWVEFYQTRDKKVDLQNGADLLLIGAILLLLSIAAIAVYCERLDVFYILPCTRCNHERQLLRETETITCCLRLDRPPPVACVLQTDCTALYQNNWLGAFFNHIYASIILFLIGFFLWFDSLRKSVYSPFGCSSYDTIYDTVYDAGLLHDCEHENNDTGHKMLYSTAIITVAAALFTIHASVYYLSVVCNRPFIVNNFTPASSLESPK
jgi:hypothetical protein